MRREITLISHSMLFYWWPIWLIGYVLALITYFEDNRLAIVPPKANLSIDQKETDEKQTVYRFAVGKPTTKSLDRAEEISKNTTGESPFKPRMSQHAWMGPVFCVILLLTVIITNVPLRGLWSFFVLLMLVVVALLISLVPQGWDCSSGWRLHIPSIWPAISSSRPQ